MPLFIDTMTLIETAPINENSLDLFIDPESDATRINRLLTLQHIELIEQGYFCGGRLLGYSDRSVYVGTLDGKSHEERADQARTVGREMAAALNESGETLQFLTLLIQGWVSTNRELRPSEDPHRGSVLIVEVANARAHAKAETIEDLVIAERDLDRTVSEIKMHEDLAVEVLSDCAKVVPHGDPRGEDEGFRAIDSQLMIQCWLGLSNHWPVCKSAAGQTKADIDAAFNKVLPSIEGVPDQLPEDD